MQSSKKRNRPNKQQSEGLRANERYRLCSCFCVTFYRSTLFVRYTRTAYTHHIMRTTGKPICVVNSKEDNRAYVWCFCLFDFSTFYLMISGMQICLLQCRFRTRIQTQRYGLFFLSGIYTFKTVASQLVLTQSTHANQKKKKTEEMRNNTCRRLPHKLQITFLFYTKSIQKNNGIAYFHFVRISWQCVTSSWLRLVHVYTDSDYAWHLQTIRKHPNIRTITCNTNNNSECFSIWIIEIQSFPIQPKQH